MLTPRSNLDALRNLTDKMVADQAIMSQVLNNIPDLVIAGRGNGILGIVSSASFGILGWLPSEMSGRPWTDFTHPDDVQKTTDIVAAAKITQTIIYDFVNRYLHKDGHYVTLTWNINPVNLEGYIYSTARRLVK